VKMEGPPAGIVPGGQDPDAIEPELEVPALDEDRLRVRAPGLRERTARGAVLNAGFMIGLELLRTVRGFTIAGVIAASQYGLYGILTAFIGTLFRLKNVGISDKFIQQAEDDQATAFQKALTLDMALSLAMSLLFAALSPLLATAFGEPELLPLGLALATVPPAIALQSPLWIFYRRMDFLRQRLLGSIDPVVALVVGVGLALAGTGAWSLIGGIVAGAWSTAIVAVISSPYRLGFSFDRATARSYFSFSWPVFLALLSTVVIAQSTTIVGFEVVGVAGVGAIALAGSLIQYANRADQILTDTMYPAICAIQDRPDALASAFTVSNRLVMLWAFPAGTLAVLFGPDLVDALLGKKWADAAVLLQAFGFIAAADQIAYNWNAFYRARGETRPIAVYAVVSAIVFLAVALPLLAAYELDGLAAGMATATAVAIAIRLRYVHRIFPRIGLISMIVSAALPTALGAAAALLLRHVAGIEAGLQVAAFFIVFAAAAWLTQRAFLREAVGYLTQAREGTG
jgi:O-antigen/teichoic acid export membrane protein